MSTQQHSLQQSIFTNSNGNGVQQQQHSSALLSFSHKFSQGQGANLHPKKEVSFSPYSSLYKYEKQHPIDNVNLWHSRQEYRSYRQNIATDVYLARGGNIITEIESLTGIQHLVCPHNALRLMQKRELHRISVLDEQGRQANSNEIDPEALKAVSEVHSKDAKVMAWMLAGGEDIGMRRRSSPAA
ncbi:predicted protein [Thalassiosira pseudonana CCMP1335]|uniref:Uncharacterized protein n=1 Tax=Thalassiosira pseudonana TaxID=35128 RepID=B8CF36_THAPS|nr:predicted protein [Thalassiosira pseudonana CCMP1335]EED88138.1 predicted protein [Thalassiosira pseudonana CCMP1335]|eukprot:scaffold944_cov115-Alexandrium_tamarense.AAC.11